MALTKITRAILDTGVSDSSDATAITINSSEQVGIGTTSPVATLQVKTQTNGNLAFQNSTSVTGGVKINCFNDAANASSPFELDGSTLQFNIAASEKMRLSSSGNLTLSDNLGVGTGTSAPNSRLQIKKDGTGNYANQTFSNANSTAGITFGIAGSGTGNYLANNAFLLNTGASNFIFGTSDTEKMRISIGGNLAIGTTTATHRLEVKSTIANYASGRIQNDTGSGSTEYGFISQLNGDPNNTTNYLYLGGSPSQTRFVVYSNGNVANTNNSYGAYSDVKLKENIVDANPQLEKIKLLQVRNFNLKAEPDKKLIGLVAQEAETIFPKLIDETEDTKNDENGAIVKTGETTKSIKYSVFVPVLIKAIQELSAKVEELEKKV